MIADRINRRKLMLVTQSAMMIFAFILWGLTALHWMTMPLLVLLSFTTGIAMALNTPSYQALVPQLVPREDLANAIALNAAQFNMSRVVGPTLGGFAMAWFGVQGNFLLNALSFVAVLVALTRIHYPPLRAAEKKPMWEDLKEGLRYVSERKELFTLLSMTAVASVLVIPYITFVPLFAKQILHLDARGFGLLMAANGGGAFLAAVTMAFALHCEAPRTGCVPRLAGVVWICGAVYAIAQPLAERADAGWYRILHGADDRHRECDAAASVGGQDAGARDEHLRHGFPGLRAAREPDGRFAGRNLYRPGFDRSHGGGGHCDQLRYLLQEAGAGESWSREQRCCGSLAP